MANAEALDGAAMLAALGVTEEPDEEPAAPAEEEAPVSEPAAAVPEREIGQNVVSVPPEFSVQRVVLTAMVEQVMLAVPSKDFYPALKSIVIDVAEDSLTLTGSNSAITVVSTSLVVRTERSGRILVPGSKFAAVVRSLAGQEVRLSATASALHITSGGGSWTLRASTMQEYPAAPELGDLSWVEVNRSAFDRAVAGTRYAAGSDEDKDHYMQLDFSGGSVVATDGFRYAQVNAELPPELSVQMATAGVDLVSKMLANNDADEFRIADSAAYHTVVEIGPHEAPDRAIIAHLMRPLPAEARNAIAGPRGANRERCVMDASELLAALSRAKPTLDSETGVVALRVSPSELTVESRNRYGDSSTETLECHFATLGSDRPPKPRSVSVVRDHLAKAVQAARRATLRVAETVDEEEEPTEAVEVVLLFGEDRSKTRLAPIMVQDVGETTQAVLSQVRSEWLT